MDLRDATLMFLAESGEYPELTRLAESAYDDLCLGREVPHTVLSDLLGEASGQGVLGTLRRKHSAAAFESIISPICREIDRQKPVPAYRGPVREP
jgi:hypothetical protein